MALEDRNLKPGTTLVARYKGKEHRCEVVRLPGDEHILYRLEDGREFKSPSSAGSAVMGGTACNGWRFWSLDDDKAKAPKKTASKKKAKKAATFEELPRADDQPEEEARYYCPACADGFAVKVAGGAPKQCPEGHKPGESDA